MGVAAFGSISLGSGLAGFQWTGARAGTAKATGDPVGPLFSLDKNILSYVNDSVAAKFAQEQLHRFQAEGPDSVTIRNARNSLLDAAPQPHSSGKQTIYTNRALSHTGPLPDRSSATSDNVTPTERLQLRLLSAYHPQMASRSDYSPADVPGAARAFNSIAGAI